MFPPGGLAPVAGSATAAATSCPWMDKSKSADTRAHMLVHAMTLDQKVHETTYSNPPWYTHYGTAGHVDGDPSLCLPDINMSDAGSGVNANGERVASLFERTFQVRVAPELGPLRLDEPGLTEDRQNAGVGVGERLPRAVGVPKPQRPPLVLVAHHDTQRSGWVWDPRLHEPGAAPSQYIVISIGRSNVVWGT